MTQTKSHIPKIRFKEFSGEWEEKKLLEVSQVITGNTPPTNNSDYYNGEYLFISPFDIKGQRFVTETSTTLTKLGFEKGRKIKKGSTVFVCIGSTIGKVAQVGEDCITNQQINSLTGINGYDNNYIYSLLNLKGKEIKLLAGVQAVPQINKTDFSNLKFLFPPLPEQQKISSFLSSVDEKIEKIKEKKKSLEEYKKGVMQKIFSQEIRFKDENGKEFGEWEEKKLGEIGETFSGLTGKSGEDFGNGKPFITYKQIFDNSKIDTSKFALVSINSGEKQNKVKYGDIFFTVSSETPKDVGMSAVLLDEVKEDLYLNSFCFGFRIKSFHIISPEFAKFYFRYQDIRKKIIILAQGSTRYNISKNEMMKIKINLPNIKEQEKIADFLSGIDEKIEKVSDEIEKMEEFKKGLLQGMFV